MRKNILGPVLGVAYSIVSPLLIWKTEIYQGFIFVRSNLNPFEEIVHYTTLPSVYSMLGMAWISNLEPFRGVSIPTQEIAGVAGIAAYLALWAGIGLVGEKLVRRLGRRKSLEDKVS